MPKYPECDHIFTNGKACQSPALKGSDYCYFHHRDRQRLRNLQQAREVKLSRFHSPAEDDALNAEILESLHFPLLEDGASIQVALSGLLRAIASGHIKDRRAALLLYGLQIAVSNISRVHYGLQRSSTYAIEDPEPIPDLNPLARHELSSRAEGDWPRAEASGQRSPKSRDLL